MGCVGPRDWGASSRVGHEPQVGGSPAVAGSVLASGAVTTGNARVTAPAAALRSVHGGLWAGPEENLSILWRVSRRCTVA